MSCTLLADKKGVYILKLYSQFASSYSWGWDVSVNRQYYFQQSIENRSYVPIYRGLSYVFPFYVVLAVRYQL